MAIKQTIKYNSTNTYFAGFLQDVINESNIKASVSQNNNEIILLVDDSDKEALARFSENINKFQSHSIFLGEIDTVKEESDFEASEFISNSYNISLCPRCLEKLTDPASESYLDDYIKCNHYSNSDDKDFIDFTTFSPHYADGSTLLLTNSQKINELFLMTEDEIKALLSIEKPTIKVTIKDETLKEFTGKNYINVKSPYSVRSTLVSLNAKDGDVPYLFFKPQKDLKVAVTQKDVIIINDSMGIEQPLEELNDDTVLNRFLNISQEAGFVSNSIGASLSVKNGISFMVSNRVEAKKVLSFQPFVLQDVMKLMREDDKKQKLLVNFEKTYPDIIKELDENGEYGLFETLACILELSSRTFEAVSDKSLEFRGNGGLKIDTFFNDNGFDYVSFIGSIMSFKLAGTEEHYLAYSTYEALGDMTISTLNQLKTKHKINNFVMMGDMFENSVLHSRIISKFSLSNPYFSKGFALDD